MPKEEPKDSTGQEKQVGGGNLSMAAVISRDRGLPQPEITTQDPRDAFIFQLSSLIEPLSTLAAALEPDSYQEYPMPVDLAATLNAALAKSDGKFNSERRNNISAENTLQELSRARVAAGFDDMTFDPANYTEDTIPYTDITADGVVWTETRKAHRDSRGYWQKGSVSEISLSYPSGAVIASVELGTAADSKQKGPRSAAIAVSIEGNPAFIMAFSDDRPDVLYVRQYPQLQEETSGQQA